MITRPKIILIGDGSVGKTSILNRLQGKSFIPAPRPTIGADFINKEITIEDKSITLNCWDTAGQERYRGLGNAFYKGAAAFLIVFEATKQNTFTNIADWIETIKQACPEAGSTEDDPQKPQIIIIANKCDDENNSVVTRNAAKSYADEIKASYYEVSAKTGSGIDELLVSIAKHQIEKLSKEVEKSTVIDNRDLEFTHQSVAGINIEYFKQRYLAQYRSECFFKNPWSKMLVDIENDTFSRMRMQNVIEHANRNPNCRTAIVLRELMQEHYDAEHGIELPRR